MKAFPPLTLATLVGFSLLQADTDKEALGKLTARIGDKFWSAPEKRLVRATIYKKEKGADDGDSAKGKSDEKIVVTVCSRHRPPAPTQPATFAAQPPTPSPDSSLPRPPGPDPLATPCWIPRTRSREARSRDR